MEKQNKTKSVKRLTGKPEVQGNYQPATKTDNFQMKYLNTTHH